MHSQPTVDDWFRLATSSDFDHVTATTNGDNLFSNDVPEARIRYPFLLILSDTSGAANTVDFDKVEEDDTTTAIHPNFNLGADETVTLTAAELGLILPRFEGGTNLQFTAGANNVEVTALFVDNESAEA